MKKAIRSFAILLIATLVLQNIIFIPAQAIEYDSDLGMYVDRENYLTPYQSSQSSLEREAPGMEHLLFPMYANSLTQLLSTHGTAKYFYKSDIDEDGYLFYTGELTSSSSRVKVGIAYKNPANGEIVSVHATSFETNKVYSSENISPSKLSSNIKYLGFINATDCSAVSGYVHYYYFELY